jgi:hypothetical protein
MQRNACGAFNSGVCIANEFFRNGQAGLQGDSMVALYLYLNGALYALFALLCTVNREGTSRRLGYLTMNASGRSEYLVIYGGLQIGLSIFFLWAAGTPTVQRAGLVLAACLYAPVVFYRWSTVRKYWPVEGSTLAIGGLESGLLLASVAFLMLPK